MNLAACLLILQMNGMNINFQQNNTKNICLPVKP